MTYLILGDIHGNLPAFELLLKKETGYDVLVCHGDVVNYGPWSDECVDLLETIPGKISLRGNHEEYFLNGSYPGEHPIAKAFFESCYPQFTKKNIVENYMDTVCVGDYTVQHSIAGEYLFKDTAIEENLVTANYIIGHSHQQFKRKIGQYEIVNTGSLGQNREFINVSNYILYNTLTGNIELKYFVHDISIVINEMKKRNYPEICIQYYTSKKIANE